MATTSSATGPPRVADYASVLVQDRDRLWDRWPNEPV
jgi:hypothetical protein